MRNTFEILVIGYMCGIVLMPGGNWQFQFWYMPLVPILFAMLPVPLVATFWITNQIFPIIYYPLDPRYHHYMLLAMMLYLVVVGPKTQENT
jgi:hypothetical protein